MVRAKTKTGGNVGRKDMATPSTRIVRSTNAGAQKPAKKAPSAWFASPYKSKAKKIHRYKKGAQ